VTRKFKSKDVMWGDFEIAECTLSGCILVLVFEHAGSCNPEGKLFCHAGMHERLCKKTACGLPRVV